VAASRTTRAPRTGRGTDLSALSPSPAMRRLVSFFSLLQEPPKKQSTHTRVTHSLFSIPLHPLLSFPVVPQVRPQRGQRHLRRHRHAADRLRRDQDLGVKGRRVRVRVAKRFKQGELVKAGVARKPKLSGRPPLGPGRRRLFRKGGEQAGQGGVQVGRPGGGEGQGDGRRARVEAEGCFFFFLLVDGWMRVVRNGGVLCRQLALFPQPPPSHSLFCVVAAASAARHARPRRVAAAGPAAAGRGRTTSAGGAERRMRACVRPPGWQDRGGAEQEAVQSVAAMVRPARECRRWEQTRGRWPSQLKSDDALFFLFPSITTPSPLQSIQLPLPLSLSSLTPFNTRTARSATAPARSTGPSPAHTCARTPPHRAGPGG
jgi:hypothetical protein